MKQVCEYGGGVELLSQPLIIPHKLDWRDSTHATVSLLNPITDYDYVISQLGLIVNNLISWQNASIWTKEMIENAVYAGTHNLDLYQGLLPNILPGDAEKTLENVYYSWHVAFGCLNSTTLRINQSVVTGWNNEVRLLSVKGYK